MLPLDEEQEEREKKGTMALKLDMSKTYDRIEWDFVEGVLDDLEFPVCLIHLIKRCISTVSDQILLNGQPSKNLSPQRGLR